MRLLAEDATYKPQISLHDCADQIWYAMDLTQLQDDSIDLKDFVLQKVRALYESIDTKADLISDMTQNIAI